MINLEEVLESNYTKWQDREYLYEKANGVFQAVTYGYFLDKTRTLADFLIDKGLSDKSVMIYGDNSINWMIADLAVLHYTGISVCVSKEWKCADVLRAVKMLDICCIIYGEEKEHIIEQVRREMPNLMCICMHSFADLFNRMEKQESRREHKCKPRKEELCCKIVFSSGTTSKPKAVMLSKKNVFAGLDSLYKRCPFNESDVDYLFLPLSHTYGGIYNFLYSLVFGFSVYLCSDIQNMAQEILEINPTLFCAVPAIYRKFYENYGSNIGIAFGSSIRYLFCGGAYFDADIRKAYKDSGLNMMEAYGLSETASTFAIQYPKDPDTESVGTIAEDIEVKIINSNELEIGEIVVKGENVFMGYAGDKELTDSVFTADGFFRTGDMGYIASDKLNGGYKLYLTGRIKKLLIGENGENVEPTHIEKAISEKNSNINRALVYMQDNNLGCQLYLRESENRNWEEFFKELNENLPKYERIMQYDIIVDSVDKRLKQ